ncbi:MAG: hypothetical protein ACREQT_00035 [Candidatus Binataceae bacterium]
MLATLVAWLLGSARVQPLVSVIEDLHWVDPSTLELIQLLVAQGATAPILLIYTARPEFYPPWPLRAHHTQLTLNRLSAREVRTMVGEVAASKALAEETVATVVERTGGVPLFVEELTRAVLESGDATLTGRAIPVTLHDSLMARLDRLGRAREVAQLGALIGNEFSYELLHAIHPISDADLQLALRALTDAELLYVRGLAPEATYQFKHALIRDAAYEALLKTHRRRLHQQAVDVLNARFPELVQARPELMAHHCTEAGLIAQAIVYWRKAGKAAIARSAHVEAIAQLRKGLELAEALPASSERLMEEIRLQMALTTPLIAIKGYTVPEVDQACNRALNLCQQIGDTPHLFGVLGGLNSIYYNRCELELALELAKQMLRIAKSCRDPALLLWAHYAFGFTLASQGKLKSARDHLQQSLSFYDRHKGGAYGYVQDPGPTALALLSYVVHSLGYPDQAAKTIREALALARSLSHQFTLAWVLGFAGEVYWKRGEKLAAQECWKERAALSEERGFKSLLESASFSLGFALAEQTGSNGGIAKMVDVYARYCSIEGLPFSDKLRWSGLLALAKGKAGELDEALTSMDEALAFAKKSAKPKDLCDLYLFKGQLLLMKNPTGLRKAKQCLSMAIRIARETHAKSDELTAVTQMARLLLQHGRRDEAGTILAAIYNWFTEGFDTADLKAAKALLDELN